MQLSRLKSSAAKLGLELDAAQLALFAAYRDELLAWNQRVNLTAIVEPAEVEVRHFVDSLWCYPALEDLLTRKPESRLVDVGAGAGFPGVPLRIACPQVRLTLVESVGKKTAFLRHLVATLGLGGVDVLTARAEDVGRDPAHRERYDVALARALAPLPVLLEFCLPLVRRGGRLVAPRRGDLGAQQREAAPVTAKLGGKFAVHIPVELGPGYDGYGLVVVEKISSTPVRYPRRAGLPAKQPLS